MTSPTLPAAALSAWSASASPSNAGDDAPPPTGASLFCAVCNDSARFVSSTQRADGGLRAYRRSSSGATWELAPGSIYLGIAVPAVHALASDATPANFLNRMVRPLLKAFGPYAMYGGRDFVTLRTGARRDVRSPIAGIAFAHDVASGRALFEAVVGTNSPFEGAGRPSFRGAVPAPYAEHSAGELVARIVAAYRLPNQAIGWNSEAEEARVQSAFLVTKESEIGTIGALEEDEQAILGGDLQASEDALNAFANAPTAENLAPFQDGRAAILGLPDLVVLTSLIDSLKRRL